MRGVSPRLRLHPLFFAVGIFYSFKGELPLFLMSCLVALQHECAHAFAAARLGYRLDKIVLMPFGAVIDGDMKNASQKDEIYIALSGPLCNLFTALFFGALWWFVPTVYAFTDTAFYASLSIALVNLLPAYPLDGGRILRGILLRAGVAERKTARICKVVTLLIGTAFFTVFFAFLFVGRLNISIAFFGAFLAVGAFGNRDGEAVYRKMDFSCQAALKRGVEIKRVAVLNTMPVKNVFRYLTTGAYLVVEVYDTSERKVFELTQNELADWFLQAPNPYVTLDFLHKKGKKPAKTVDFNEKVLAKRKEI